jgi:hypothetical protein
MTEQINLPSIVKNVIEHVSLDEIKKALFEEVKESFVFGPTEYVEGYDTSKRSIFQKIANVMGGLDRVPKSGYNKKFEYYYVTESDVVGAVRPLMAKEGLVMMPSIKSYQQSDLATKYSTMYMGTIEIEWIVRDTESYEMIKFTMIGKGTDNLEKDIYKAISGNKKYALISLFLIDSGDDPERNDTPDFERPGTNQDGQNQPKRSGNTNTSKQQTKSNPGESDKPKEEPKPKQPSKSELLTRWVVLEGETDKDKKVVRAEFDEWVKKQTEKGWDNRAMMQALTKKIMEKNDAQKKASKEADQADQKENAPE